MLALLYDVHGNLAALDAVLADARGQGADRWLLGGDYALFGPQPEATVERLRALTPPSGSAATASAGPPTRRGARQPGRPARDRRPARDALGDATRRPSSAALPAARAPRADALRARLAGLRRPLVLPRPADDEDELLAGVAEPRLVFGHTHLPFRRIAATGGIELVNPGSVGMPFDGDPRAAYALVHDDRRVEHRRVAYDHGAAAARLRERWPGEAWADTVARRVEQARMDV